MDDLLYRHESVKYSVGRYVKGKAHTNGIKSFWSMLKRSYCGTHHHMSHRRRDRYVNEFSVRHNNRRENMITQIANIAAMMSGSRLICKTLVA